VSRGGGSGSGGGGSIGGGGSGDAGGSDNATDGGPIIVEPTPRSESTRSMDTGWKFLKDDATGAEAPGFSDAAWTTVSTPHSYNDVDSYDELILHSSGEAHVYQGPVWYRKHFKIPTEFANGKAIIEFERIRHGAKFYINGTAVGVFDDGITACGIDVTGKVNFGATDNVLAVRVDNSANYAESTTGVGYQWSSRATNPNFGGLVGHVWLHLPGKIHQTYPLYNNLLTSGIYIYPSGFANVSASQGDLTVNVESQVRNDSAAAADVTLSADVVDPQSGATAASFKSVATPLAAGQTAIIKATGAFAKAKLWSDVTPNLYNVVTKLSVNGAVVNSRVTMTGFRQAEFRGGVGTGGVYINGRFVFLLGYAQRATNEWAAIGQAVPDWMHDYHAKLLKGSNSNYVRWMHVAPQLVDTQSNDRYGIVNIAPAGDKETEAQGAQWTQRTKVMRSTIIYLRNNPSVFFWETGNSGISAAHQQEMYNIKKQWDPSGGRAIGCRSLVDAGGAPYSEMFGTLVAYDPSFKPVKGTDFFRGYSPNYRDQAPIVEMEDQRQEAARRFWDDYTPPHLGGFKPGAKDAYALTSESMIVGVDGAGSAIARLNIWKNLYNIHNSTDSDHSRYSAYASIYFSDSNADGRQESTEVCRVGGKVDAVRLPKQIYYAHRVVGATQPDIHIIGHWTYPAATKKTMYVIANTPSVELFVNGTSVGKSSTPADRYTFSFPNVAWAAGTIKAVGYDMAGAPVAQHELQTAGPAVKIKLTPTVGPAGLQADGVDIAMFDVEVVDAKGQRVPSDEAPVSFTTTGPGIWRGGFNSSVLDSINKTTLLTEAGINRVFVRSTLAAGTITVTASRSGLTSDTATVVSKAVTVVDGLR